MLHVSFDAARFAFAEIDANFESDYVDQHCNECFVSTHHAGSIQQANSIASGLIADIASFASPMELFLIDSEQTDTQSLHFSIAEQSVFPFNSTIVWLCKPTATLSSGDWKQLLSDPIRPSMADPDHSGAGRYAYLAILVGFRDEGSKIDNLHHPDSDKLFTKIPILGDRASVASANFLGNRAINLLITWESEALRLKANYPHANLKIIYPDHPIRIDPIVVKMTHHTLMRGTEERTQDYVSYLSGKKAQLAFAHAGFRPRDPEVAAKFDSTFPPLALRSIPECFGSWDFIRSNAFGIDGHFAWVKTIRNAQIGGSE